MLGAFLPVATPAEARGAVTVWPRNVLIGMGRTQVFKAHVTGVAGIQTVTWSVEGGAANGTITGAGVYTPPTALPGGTNQVVIVATSVQAPNLTGSATVTLVTQTDIKPPSANVFPGGTQQFVAASIPAGGTYQWCVNGILGGNGAVGTISQTGLYTAPNPRAGFGSVEIKAVNSLNSTDPGIATAVLMKPPHMDIYPGTVSALPCAQIAFHYSTNIYPAAYRPMVTWQVDGIAGGNAVSGTITSYGLYSAPCSPGVHTVTVLNAAKSTYTARSTVTLTANAGATSLGLMTTSTKILPYDVYPAPPATLTISAAQREYAPFQVIITANGEELSGVDISQTDWKDGAGHSIRAGPCGGGEGAIYFERMLNIFYLSRAGDAKFGEWPDPLIPKVDKYACEKRDAFPFEVRRISNAYKKYLIGPNGNKTGYNGSHGLALSSGTYTGSVLRKFQVIVDGAGNRAAATFKWTIDGGATFVQTGVAMNACPCTLQEGVRVDFKDSVTAPEFQVADEWWIWAGPMRNQGIWLEQYVPVGQPPGTYSSTITITKNAGQTILGTLVATLVVGRFALPLNPPIPNLYANDYNGVFSSHYGRVGGEDRALYANYAAACVIHWLSCTGNKHAPMITFNADNSVATSNYGAPNTDTYEGQTGPALDGRLGPPTHGEKQTVISSIRRGGNDAQIIAAGADQLAHHIAMGRGSTTMLVDYSQDEPKRGDIDQTFNKASMAKQAGIRSLVTTRIDFCNRDGCPTAENYNGIGYIDIWVPNIQTLMGLHQANGSPDRSSREYYNKRLAAGDLLWWYDSCVTHGCGSLGSMDGSQNSPNHMIDTPAPLNRLMGLWMAVPVRANGVVYFGVASAYHPVDPYDSVYFFGGNGDGALLYPGRPAGPGGIGGKTHIPIESMRLKYDREAMYDTEYANLLMASGQTNFVNATILPNVENMLAFDPTAAAIDGMRAALFAQLNTPAGTTKR
jgi:hypothetical protein